MKKLFLALVLVLMAVGGSFASHGYPIDKDATLSGQTAVQCDDGVILDQGWKAADGREWRVFKQPGKDPAIVVYWNAGNDGKSDEIYVYGKPATMEQVIATFGEPCGIIKPGA